jgi:hypothetical protein
VVALYDAAGPITQPLFRRRREEVRNKLTVLVATAPMLAM